jgi:glycogen operon protein
VLHLILNAYWEPLVFDVPPLEAGLEAWRRILDTSLASPDDLVSSAVAPLVDSGSYRAGPRSVVILRPAARRAAEPTAALR